MDPATDNRKAIDIATEWPHESHEAKKLFSTACAIMAKYPDESDCLSPKYMVVLNKLDDIRFRLSRYTNRMIYSIQRRLPKNKIRQFYFGLSVDVDSYRQFFNGRTDHGNWWSKIWAEETEEDTKVYV